MKTTCIGLAVVAATVFTQPAFAQASSFSNCDVIEIVATGEQNAHVQLSCVPINPPACATGVPYVAFDKSTPEGKQYLALFIYAQATNAKVTGWVSAACPAFQPNVALLAHLRVKR